MGAITWPWYNGSYTMAAKPIKSLELHYTMIEFLMNKVILSNVALQEINTKKVDNVLQAPPPPTLPPQD